ncbi:hypothetical protein PpBr36_09081 [Pyricularia pennisetigena]|uniref:hypothetical protein n=1 Tax=Pyricularia pennisetigena TaxID=1578925 RepID=UPI00115451EA|nr:hypothetical protein PpBr36_09081 [Pyricularia pennisetigena]TLS24268.1 hypothetical protein PpBr36_09081 [Pyricularia pennisetigena]
MLRVRVPVPLSVEQTRARTGTKAHQCEHIRGAVKTRTENITFRVLGVKEDVYGISPVGILIYTGDGFMSATITSTHPQDTPAALSFPPQADQSDHDWATVAKHSISYAGPFVINDQMSATETSGQVFHGPFTVANVPSSIGTKQARNYTLYENGRLLFITSKRGDGSVGQLWWVRST